MQEIHAHQNILKYFSTCVQNKALAHAYAFIGANNIGRTETLKNFLSEFLSSDISNHPDVNILNPEKDIISIDAIRKARTWLSMTPISADKKALVVNSAHTMNTQAQSAFLKILEEPAENTYIFLIINHKDQILQTIYSRIVPIYFSGSSKNYEAKNPKLIQEIIAEQDISERMRIWAQSKMEKENMRAWLKDTVPELRKNIIINKSKRTAAAARDLLEKLSNPKSQNWQLAAENLIISI